MSRLAQQHVIIWILLPHLLVVVGFTATLLSESTDPSSVIIALAVLFIALEDRLPPEEGPSVIIVYFALTFSVYGLGVVVVERMRGTLNGSATMPFLTATVGASASVMSSQVDVCAKRAKRLRFFLWFGYLAMQGVVDALCVYLWLFGGHERVAPASVDEHSDRFDEG